MKVLVCGSRTWTDMEAIYNELAQLPPGTTIIHGGARGADTIAANVGKGLGFNVIEVLPDWEAHGRFAGVRRNGVMINMGPDLVIAFQQNDSKGTANTIYRAYHRGIETRVIKED